MEVKRTRELNQSNMEQAETISMEFTEEELTTLNNGILSLIEKTGQARALVPDTEAHITLHVYCTKLQALSGWVCEGKAGGGTWNRKNRPRQMMPRQMSLFPQKERYSTERKIRWGKCLK